MRIAQIALASADPAAQADFWGGRLGLPVRESGDAVEVVLQRSTIRFEPADDGIDPRYHFAINVPPGSIEDAAAWLGSRHEILEFHDDPDVEEGATIVRGDRGGLSFYFLDGGGSVVELMANPRIDDDLEGQFGPDSLLEIAEIGVASADTAATRAAIEETFGADVLWGGREAWRADGDRRRPRCRDRRAHRSRLDPRRPARGASADDDRRGGPSAEGDDAARGSVPPPGDLASPEREASGRG